MTSARVDQIITVVGAHLYQAIADLLGKLLKRQPQLSDRGVLAFTKSGYSAAIILLFCTVADSFVIRDRYFLKQSVNY